MSDDWITYAEAAHRLGTTPEAVAARARRHGWPRQRANKIGELARVQIPEGVTATPPAPISRPTPPHDTPNTPDSALDALHRVADMLDRERLDRRTLQGQADDLRQQLAAAQLDAAKATGAAELERQRRQDAERRLAEVEARLVEIGRRGFWRRLLGRP